MKTHLTIRPILLILLFFILFFSNITILSADDCSGNHAPNQPTNQFPISGTTGFSRNSTLSWICNDSDNDDLVYDVYFDTRLPAQKQVSKQNNTSYNPGLLQYNTQYYWIIVAYDPCGQVSISPLWTFTTEENLNPHMPVISNVYPEDDAVNVPLSATLSVTVTDQDQDSLLVTFYDETDTIIESVEGMSGNTFSTNWNNLAKNTVYHWYATISDDTFLITSPTYQFTTTNDNMPPIAEFSITPNNPIKNTSVTFDASQSYDPDGTITGYRWDFTGSGKFTSWQTNATITNGYNTNGSYTVHLEIRDNDDQTNTTSFNLYIGENQAPNKPSQPKGPVTGIKNNSIPFSVSTTDINGDDIRYGWDWDNDDIVDEWTQYYESNVTVETSHQWNTTGTYKFQVLAQDEHGLTSDFSVEKTISITQSTQEQSPSLIPTNPSPENNSNNVNLIGSYLRWETTDSDEEQYRYNIYLNSSPSLNTPHQENLEKQEFHLDSLQKDTTYYWKVLVIDQEDGYQIEGPVWKFTTTNNSLPSQPQKPTPANGETNVDPCSLSLTWESNDPDNDELEYIIYFDDSSNPSTPLGSPITSTSVSAGMLDYDTTYHWSVQVTDKKSNPVKSIDWSFKTKPDPCQAKITGPTDAHSGDEVTFSASTSTCDNAPITSYEWDFGDGETANGETVSHVFRGNETFTVTLTVICKPDCLTCSHSTTHKIHIGNHKPDKPTVSGGPHPFIGGQKQGSYAYTVKGHDIDGDNIRFRFDWGDNTSNTVTEYVSSGKELTVTHTWMEPGDYEIKVYAEDEGGSMSLPVHKTASIGSAVNIAMVVIVLLGIVIVTVQVVFVIFAHRKKMFD